MLKLYSKSLVFVFCLFLLLCIAPLLEQPQKELEGRALQNFSLAEVGPLPVLHFQAPVFNEKEEVPVALPANPEPMSFEDQLDDIAEKLDIIQQQVNELVAEAEANEPQKLEEDKIEEEKNEEDEAQEQEKLPEKTEEQARTVFERILISEVQIASPTSEKEEFVKLYNPNNEDVDLTDWYLQRKTKDGQDYSTFVSNNLFLGKKITANGYFLICREGYYFNGLCNIFTENPLTEGNSLVLKNPNREISDEFLTVTSPVVIVGGGGGGGPPPPVYQNILINEVQVEGETTKDDWIELYNPNDADVFLSNYNGSYLRLVRRAKTSLKDYTVKSWSADADAKIPAGGFYLWASSSNDGYPLSVGADCYTKQNISADNGIALRLGPENTGEIIDAVGWGDFNNVLLEGEPALESGGGQSIIRVDEIDTNDNSKDFVISNIPTPKAENQEWLEPPINDSGDYFSDSGDYH